jgi:hypothetical protein
MYGFFKWTSSYISITVHCGLWPVEHYPSIFPYLSPILSIFSLPVIEDLLKWTYLSIKWPQLLHK